MNPVSSRKRDLAPSIIVAFLMGGCGGSSSPPLPPTTQSFSATTTIGQALTLNVLAHDTDPYGGPLIVRSASVTAGGTAVVTASGQVTFTPTSGFSGPTTVLYVVSNAEGGQATGQVTVTVTPAPHRVLAALEPLYGGGDGELAILDGGQDVVVANVVPTGPVIFSSAHRYVAYGYGFSAVRVVDVSSITPVQVQSIDGSILAANFTADEQQIWVEVNVASTTAWQLLVADLPSGNPAVVAQFPSNAKQGTLTFAADDSRVFYGVDNSSDPAASGVFWVDRAGPWTPNRVTPIQSAPSNADSGSFAVDPTGTRVMYEILDTTGGFSQSDLWSVAVGDPAGAFLVDYNAGLMSVSPAGNLAFVATGALLGDQPIPGPTELVSTQVPGQVWLSANNMNGAFRSDGAQAVVVSTASMCYLGQLSAVNLLTLNATPQGAPTQAIDTLLWLSPLTYAADGKLLLYLHQAPTADSCDPTDSTANTARLYAWDTSGARAPVQVAPAVNEQVTRFAIAADNRTVAFTTLDNGQTRLYLVDITAPAYAMEVPLSASDAANYIYLYGVL